MTVHGSMICLQIYAWHRTQRRDVCRSAVWDELQQGESVSIKDIMGDQVSLARIFCLENMFPTPSLPQLDITVNIASIANLFGIGS